MEEEVKVTGCSDCPLLNTSEYGWYCNHDGAPADEIELGTKPMPDWCPLKQSSLTIKLV